jgi:hypothetical protein
MRGITATITVCAAAAALAGEPGPQFDSRNQLQRPSDYREWIFLTSDLGLTYGPSRSAPGQAPAFSNVFVNPYAYRAFMQSGKWPDGTMFVLEIRASVDNSAVNAGGRTQGQVRAIEASVKDSRRYPDGGWAYFSFDGKQGPVDSATPFARSESCYDCHSRHGAVEWTFTQFYPRQFEVATRFGTVRKDYDPDLTPR